MKHVIVCLMMMFGSSLAQVIVVGLPNHNDIQPMSAGSPFPVGKNKAHQAGKQRAEGDVEDACDAYTKRWNRNGDDKCSYKECVSKRWQVKNCPDGKGITNQLQSGNYRGSGQPCTQSVIACTRTLAEKGLGNIDVKICQMDLILAIDISCSLDKNRGKLASFVKSLVNVLPISALGTQIGGIAFSEKTYHISYMNSFVYAGLNYLRRPAAYARKVFNSFSYEPDKCATRGDLALKLITTDYFTAEHGKRKKAKPVVIYFTDGVTYPDEKKKDTIQAARDMKAAGIHCVVVALPNDNQPMSAGKEEFEAIASPPVKENIMFLSSFDELKSITNTLLKKACQTI